jgi:hypothetical protein
LAQAPSSSFVLLVRCLPYAAFAGFVSAFRVLLLRPVACYSWCRPLPPLSRSLLRRGAKKSSFLSLFSLRPALLPSAVSFWGGRKKKRKKNEKKQILVFVRLPAKPPEPTPRLQPENFILGFFGCFSKTRFFLSFLAKKKETKKKEKKRKKEKKKEKKCFFKTKKKITKVLVELRLAYCGCI